LILHSFTSLKFNAKLDGAGDVDSNATFNLDETINEDDGMYVLQPLKTALTIVANK